MVPSFKRLLVDHDWGNAGQQIPLFTSVCELALHGVWSCETYFKPLGFYFVFYLIYNKIPATVYSQPLSHWMFLDTNCESDITITFITCILQVVQTQRKLSKLVFATTHIVLPFECWNGNCCCGWFNCTETTLMFAARDYSLHTYFFRLLANLMPLVNMLSLWIF